MENTVPKDTSSMPTPRASEGTAGPRALTNNPIKKKEENMATEGASRFTSRAGVIPLFLRKPQYCGRERPVTRGLRMRRLRAAERWAISSEGEVSSRRLSSTNARDWYEGVIVPLGLDAFSNDNRRKRVCFLSAYTRRQSRLVWDERGVDSGGEDGGWRSARMLCRLFLPSAMHK